MTSIKVAQSIHQALKELLTDNPNLILIYDNLSDHQSLIHRFGKDRVIKNELEGGCLAFAYGAKFFNLSVVLEINEFDCISKKDLGVCFIESEVFLNGSVVIRVNMGRETRFDYLFRSLAIILAPFSCKDHLGLLKKAAQINKPVFILENTNLYDQEFEYFPTFHYAYTQELAPISLQEGCDITFISYSEDINSCIYISESLRNTLSKGILNIICLKPLDKQVLIDQAEKCKVLVVISRIDVVTQMIKEIYMDVNDRVFYLDYKLEREKMVEKVVEIAEDRLAND